MINFRINRSNGKKTEKDLRVYIEQITLKIVY